MWFLMRDIVGKNHFWRLRCEVRLDLYSKEISKRIQAHKLADLVNWKAIYGMISSNDDMSERDTLFCMDCGILQPTKSNNYGQALLKRACKHGFNQVVERCLVAWKIDPTLGERGMERASLLENEMPNAWTTCLETACWYG